MHVRQRMLIRQTVVRLKVVVRVVPPQAWVANLLRHWPPLLGEAMVVVVWAADFRRAFPALAARRNNRILVI